PPGRSGQRRRAPNRTVSMPRCIETAKTLSSAVAVLDLGRSGACREDVEAIIRNGRNGRLSMRTIWAVLATALCLVAVSPSPASAIRCLGDAGDAAQIGDTRSAIDAVCPCFKYDDTPQKSHANYAKCAKDVIKARAGVGLLRPQCKSAVAKYYSA